VSVVDKELHMKYDCVIVGAGVSGLIAANELVKNEKKVLILEAQERAGGRIYALDLSGINSTVELGAEFLHGDVVITKALLDKAGISYQSMRGKTYQIRKGELSKDNPFDQDWQRIIRKLGKLEEDVPFRAFLNKYFPGEKHKPLHENITKFVEGYSAADANKVSSLALREEWSEEEDPVQNRPIGGYRKLVEFLLRDNDQKRIDLKYSSAVKHVNWQKDSVEIITAGEHLYTARKILITVPLGVLQHEKISFSPPIIDYIRASKEIGFGSVIKFHIAFKGSFWKKYALKKFKSVKFIFSDAAIPTWWSQLPDEVPMLTGWLGGPSVDDMTGSESGLKDVALQSLSYILGCTIETLRPNISAMQVKNWKHDPFTLGAYSYSTTETNNSLKILQAPVEGTIYFAGEAIYSGPHTGTVEAALVSGRDAALSVLAES
jgi:monoamine oxidase